MSSSKANERPFTFTREHVSCLIELYEQHPLLYEASYQQYKNKSRRLMALREITREFSNKFPLANLSVEDVRKKINALRTQFFSESNKVKKSQISGAGSDELYNISEPQNTAPAPSSSFAEENSGDDSLTQSQEEEMLFDGTLDELNELSSPLTSPNCSRPSSKCAQEPPVKKRKISTTKTPGALIMEKAALLLECATKENVNPGPLDTIDSFTLSVGAELRQIRSTQRCRTVRRKIMDLIYEAQEEEEEEDM